MRENRFEGIWKEDDYGGLGREYHENGLLKSEGLFLRGDKYFKGRIWGVEGGKLYEGEKVNGECRGIGTSFWGNGGFKYRGTWKDDRYSGFGTLYHNNGQRMYDGNFEGGKMHGFGEKFDLGGGFMFKAFWVRNQVESFEITEDQTTNGHDILEIDPDRVYIGKAVNSERNGAGVTWSKSRGVKIYEGNYYRHKVHGFGKLYFQNQSDHPIIEFLGHFKAGKASGNGIQFDPSGKILLRGECSEGKINKTKFYIIYDKNGKISNYCGNV